MSRCVSCNLILEDYELGRKIEVQVSPDEYIEVDEDMCGSCRRHTYWVDEESIREYQHQHLTEDINVILGIQVTPNYD